MRQQFAEAKENTQRQFAEARDDRRQLMTRLDALFQEIGRLQGVVERTYEPERFTTTPPARRTGAAGAVREPAADYGPASESET